jgi:hypothetical protein
MKKIRFVFMSIMLLLVLGAGNALAEDTLETVMYNHFGNVSNYHEITTTNNFEFQPGNYEVTAILADKRSGFGNPVGWYDAAAHIQYPLFDNPAGQVSKSLTFTASKTFGIY